jgi:chromosome segregation ATPase
MSNERLDRVEDDMDTLKTVVLATARHAESAQASFARLNDRLDEYIYQAQRILGDHEDRIISAQGSAERLEAVFAMQQRHLERLDQNQETFQRQLVRLDENQGALQQLATTQQEQLNRQQQTEGALQQLATTQQEQLNRQQQNQGALQLLVATQQEQMNAQQRQIERVDDTLRSTNAALEQLGSIMNQILRRDP